MSIFTMPSLGADMEEGKLIEWLVKPGDRVAKGDIVAVVETQKGAIEIEVFEAGVIAALLAAPGETLPVGAPLARLGEADEGVPPTAAPPRPDAPKAAGPPVAEVAGKPVAEPVAAALPVGGAPLLASPAARARAAELGLKLGAVHGSGPGGAVLLADVERAAIARPAPTASGMDSRPKGKPGLDMVEMRRAIATAMTRSKREIPHYYLCHEIDLQSAQDWLTAHNADRVPDQRRLMGALLVRATVRALAKVPELNGRFEAEPYAPSAAIHCGLAVALRGGGLIAPAILNTQDMDLDAIMTAMRDMVARTRTGRLRNSEITQGTITVSSLGETGVDALVGVIYPPQVALVGFGAPRLKPVVFKGAVQPRLAVTVSLAADHRISDGRRGAQFLAEIDRFLQEPESQ
ncbi:dihydrolipoamide acetyltransferase family protein [Cypionkella sp.]|jgi:pyruvate dehydrogenase E2 component (dihydrolipoamide acetyltransferase)|uniref:dihydrolipoamide acetyltransferase family protein n=1 Tax=Cypionkella sp. TaxID=2811411 RepID=UPI002722DC81|nr:dihydrolipoamide acetyltransferase family protein [Cypionkella sp.]MDO8985974.1 dihydrolipoamide acetyltransferase family protein [Cypionkella sp.]MDP2048162.1 dihydrolipoamide acetyltransferase family protein [Cypionkella sp.]